MAMSFPAFFKPRSRIIAPAFVLTGKVQMVGVGLLLTLVLCALFAPVLAPYDPKAEVCEAFAPPNGAHWLGCDDFGQDLFSQLVFGARTSLFVGLTVASLAVGVATFLAFLSGLSAGEEKGSWVDRLLMRLVDVALALPFLPLVIVLGVYFGASIGTQILVITLVMWAQPLREMRAQILSIKAATFVEASRTMGASGRFVSLRHILPELAPLIVPQFVRVAHQAILVEAALGFLGLGDPLSTSWGTMLFHANGRAAFLTGAWVYWILPPGLAIATVILALAFIGYGFDGALSARGPLNGAKRRRNGPRTASHGEDEALLAIDGLEIAYLMEGGDLVAIKDVCLSIRRGELVGLVGASGSGKSTLALAILGLLRASVDIRSGSILFDGADLLALPGPEMRDIRREKIALIPQNAMNALNPVLTIGEQVMERLAGKRLSRVARLSLAKEWMEKVGLNPAHLSCYPHVLSGGMRQRAVIAIALCSEPELLIADEPTSGLDMLVQQDLMALLLGLRDDMGLTMLLISHNVRLVARHCDRVVMMEQREMVEVAGKPAHLPFKALMEAMPAIDEPRRWPSPKKGSEVGAEAPFLMCSHLSKHFTVSVPALWGNRQGGRVNVLQDVSFTLDVGDAVGLVGGSGEGKTTLARLLVGMLRPDAGSVRLGGKSWDDMSPVDVCLMRQRVHMVFQDPYQSLNNRLRIADLVAEPLQIAQGGAWRDHRAQICEALEMVRLPTDPGFLSRHPVCLSGGQRQRVALARAIILRPSLIIADEPTSMLDPAIRIEVMDVMAALRAEFRMAFLFISHDVALARHFCDRLLELRDGHLVGDLSSDAFADHLHHRQI
nr:ATP-binding cassette domain-containing protein [uncultured Cohaesibacter sp.]